MTPLLSLSLLLAGGASASQLPLGRPPQLEFTLRHDHALSPTGLNLFHDVPPPSQGFISPFSVQIAPQVVYRPKSREDFTTARVLSRRRKSMRVDWSEESVNAPDVTERRVLLELAKMTNNAYHSLPGSSGWYDLGGEWNSSYPFGWEPDADGFRGQVFATADNSTVVLSIKGTSVPFLGAGGPSSKKDKLNDNLMWSCCCARVDWTWTTVCDCYSGSGKCDQTCLEDALAEESLFYPIAINLYNNLTMIYPTSNIWITGHSLGGGLASLLGVTFGNPVVTFESPGERLVASRLHLPSPPSTQHITHVYHTADPVPMGACTGPLSSCGVAGIALETHCHLGKTILYDTVTILGWKVNIAKHRLKVIIEELLGLEWNVPIAEPERDCVDCYAWHFGDFNKSSTFI